MYAKKIKTHKLEKCYAIAPLKYNNEDYILVAAEKNNKCLLFDLDGNLVDTIWDGPGGTMSMVQVPGSDGQFIATQQFYSPNDSKEAKLVLVTPISKGNWDVKIIAKLPFVHRFDIIRRNNINYIIACTIKSKHEFKDDWNHPGKILTCILPNDLSDLNENNLLKFDVLKDGLTKNHGYCRINKSNEDYCLIAAQDGVYKVSLTDKGTNDWYIKKIINEPCSDMAMTDFDNDGIDEIITISPFHGDIVKVYKKINEKYEVAYTCPIKLEFAHSIWAGNLYGKNCAIIGHRKGKRDIVGFSYENGYRHGIIDNDVGSANILKYKKGSIECLVSTNREIDEIAFYEFIE